jgi:hypothetical protein
MAFVTFALVGLSSAQNIVTCPVGSWGNPGAYVKVVYVAQSMKWQEAENYCVSEHNGHLISTHSIEENNCIAEKVLPPHVPGTGMWNQGWIGLTDNQPYSSVKGSYAWTDGSGREPSMWTNWDPQARKVEGCGVLNANNTDVDERLRSTWSDFDCDLTSHFVCEVERFNPDCPGVSTTTGYWNTLPLCESGWNGKSEQDVQPLCNAMCKSKCSGSIAGIATLASPTGKGSTCVCYESSFQIGRPIGRTPVGGCSYTSTKGSVVSESCSKALWKMPVTNIKWPLHNFNVGLGFGDATSSFPYGTGQYSESTKSDIHLIEADSDWNFEQCLEKGLVIPFKPEGPCYKAMSTQQPNTCTCRGDVSKAPNVTSTCAKIDALPCSMTMSFSAEGKPWTANNIIESCFPNTCTNADIQNVADYLVNVWAPVNTPSPTFPSYGVPAPTPQFDELLPTDLKPASTCGGNSKSSSATAEIAGGVAAGVVVLGLGGFLFMKFSGRSGGSGLSSSLVANKRGTLF